MSHLGLKPLTTQADNVAGPRFHGASRSPATKGVAMQLGMIGLGRMGANMVRRLMQHGHECVVFDANADAVAELQAVGARGTSSVEEFIALLKPPRAVWIMLPVPVVEGVVKTVAAHLQKGDILVDGGNSPFENAIRRASELKPKGIHFVDVGTSGGVWGLERGYCLMIGGSPEAVQQLDADFPGSGARQGRFEPLPGARRRCGIKRLPALRPAGRGPLRQDGPQRHRVRNDGRLRRGLQFAAPRWRRPAGRARRSRSPERYQYDFDLGAIAELWRRGSVVTSWLLDLTAISLAMIRSSRASRAGCRIPARAAGR